MPRSGRRAPLIVALGAAGVVVLVLIAVVGQAWYRNTYFTAPHRALHSRIENLVRGLPFKIVSVQDGGLGNYNQGFLYPPATTITYSTALSPDQACALIKKAFVTQYGGPNAVYNYTPGPPPDSLSSTQTCIGDAYWGNVPQSKQLSDGKGGYAGGGAPSLGEVLYGVGSSGNSTQVEIEANLEANSTRDSRHVVNPLLDN